MALRLGRGWSAELSEVRSLLYQMLHHLTVKSVTRGNSTKTTQDEEAEKLAKKKALLDPSVKPEYLNHLQLTADDDSEHHTPPYLCCS